MKTNYMTTLPPKTTRSKTPPMPVLSMLTFIPPGRESERKALLAINDQLRAEDGRKTNIMLWGFSLVFFCGFIAGAFCKVGP